ncbi:low molecular weight phosphatase family protein [Paenibacillus hexagrammi]|uniref:hypothetical protein n=1 Tax=Paenibacillus hexagrammi TaxID=2908839 RepID=UPI0028832CF2|nr:hypothetical protein [Paenibacillus sp. YPD9-1]
MPLKKTYTLKEYVEDDPKVIQVVEEREKLISELQLKQALSEPITDEERQRYMMLDLQAPDYDISDPFGGPIEVYRETAAEIDQFLDKLIPKIREWQSRSKS